MKMKGYVAYFVILSVFLMQRIAFAQEQGELGECRVGATVFWVSWSGDGEENGERTLAITNVTGEKIPIPLKPNSYVGTGTDSESVRTSNRCEDVVGLPIGEDRILLFLAAKYPPVNSHLSLALLDANHLSVVDTKDDVGEINPIWLFWRNHDSPDKPDSTWEEEYIILRRVGNSEFDIRIIREGGDIVCDCLENQIEDWMRIRVDEKGISTRWMRP